MVSILSFMVMSGQQSYNWSDVFLLLYSLTWELVINLEIQTLPLEYTKVWTELIDRGGLYHISDDVFNLVQNIEAFVRRHMNTETLTSQSSSNLKPLIREELFSCHQLISLWDKIAHSIPHKYEKYSLELLRIIADLWITIRGHSFAKNFTMQFVKKYTKGIRKTLKA